MRRMLAPAVCLSLVLTTAAWSAPTAKKPARPAATRPVKGTVQMAGDSGKMGVTYTIGNKDAALNFTLLSAEYTVTRLALNTQTIRAANDEKFLVMHYTIQNPNPRETYFTGNTLKFTVVDSEDTNRESLGIAGKEGSGEWYALRLKPAQKVAVWSAFRLPAKATAPKLIVQRGGDLPVLRLYFGPRQIKGLPEPFADAADATGATPLTEIPATPGTYYALGRLDARLVSTTTSDQPVGPRRPGRGKQLFIATFSVRNSTYQRHHLAGGSWVMQATTDDGDKTEPGGPVMLKAGSDENCSMFIEPNEEATVRVILQVNAGTKVKTLSLADADRGRRFVFALGEAQ